MGLCEEDRNAPVERDVHAARSAGYVWPEATLQGLRHAEGQRLQGGAREIAGDANQRQGDRS